MSLHRGLYFLPILCLLPLSGCRPAIKNDGGATPIAFPNDDLGRPVNLTAPAKRLVIIGPGLVESLYAMGAGSLLVGRDQIATVPPLVAQLPIVGDYKGPFTEKVATLHPDLVIVQGETYTVSDMDTWQRQCGAPTAALNAKTLTGVADDVEKLGRWIGNEASAKGLAVNIRATTSPAKPKTRIFIEVGRSPLWTAGANTLVGEIVGKAFINSASADYNVKGYQPFGWESLYAKEPRAYLVTDTRPRDQVLKELRAEPHLAKLSCIREGRVVVIDGDLVLRPGPRLVQGIALLKAEAKALEAPTSKATPR